MTALKFKQARAQLDEAATNFFGAFVYSRPNWGSQYNQDVKKWANKSKKTARLLWKAMTHALGVAADWGDHIELAEPELTNTQLEGFKVAVFGAEVLSEDMDLDDMMAKFKAALALLRTRANKVMPLLLDNMLPIKIMFNESAVGRQGYYISSSRKEIHITLAGMLASKERFVLILSHEMGHHIYQTVLNSDAIHFWEQVVRGDYDELDLNDVLTELRTLGIENLSSTQARLKIKQTNPVMYLQLQSLDWQPNGQMTPDFSIEGIEEHLELYGSYMVVPKNPISAYASKNEEEAFCEAVGKLVSYGHNTLPEPVLVWLKTVIPTARFAHLIERVASRYLSPHISQT